MCDGRKLSREKQYPFKFKDLGYKLNYTITITKTYKNTI